MKFGCCVNLLPETEVPAGIGYAGELKKLGYDYIELPLNQLTQLEDGEFEKAVETLKEIGLPCRSCNDFMPSVYQIVGEDLTPEKELERYLVRAFHRLERLKAPYTVFGSPWSRSCPAGFPMERALDQVAGFLRRAGRIAADHGVVIAIEPINRSETNVMNHYADGVTMARRVDRPNVRVLCDYYHLRYEGDSPQVLLDGGGALLVHTHIAKLEGRRYFTGLEGELPMVEQYAQALKALGYAGGISIEARVESREAWRREAEQTVKLLRRVFQ